MYSEMTIARQVEARLNRRLLLVADGSGWAFFLWVFKYTSFAHFEGMAVLLALIWTGVLGLHFLWTVYAELRDWLVQRAIKHEQRFYVAEKPKRTARPRLDLADDGELIDYEFPESAGKPKIERR